MTQETSSLNNEHLDLINNRISSTTKKEVLSLIDEVNNKNTSESRAKDIIKIFYEYILTITIPVAQHHFYRARYWSNEPNFPAKLNQLLEPLPAKTGIGRCNIKDNPVLYVTTDPRALVAECRYKPGAVYALTQFDRTLKTEDLQCLHLGLHYLLEFPGDSMMQEIEAIRKNTFGKNYPMYQFIEETIHKQFIKSEDNEGLSYRFTANLCNMFFRNPKLDAIVYPSIETCGAVNNLAIRPEKYLKTYIASKVGLFEVLEDGSSRQLMGAIIDDQEISNWDSVLEIDQPVGVNIRQRDPNDKRIYIAPWK